MQVTYTCKGPKVQDSETRVPCGKDITEAILAVPVDGEEHEVACPACGTKTTVRRIPAPAQAESN